MWRSRSVLRLAAVLVAALVLISGCTQLLAIDADALVVGAGLDAGSRPGAVEVQFQWFHHGSPSGSSGGGLGGGGGSSAKQHLITLAGAGPDVPAAVAGVRDQTDQHILFSEIQLLVLGKGLARRGVGQPLGYFWRKSSFPETAQVAVAAGRAGQLLRSQFPGGIAMELQRRLVRSQLSDTGSVPIPFWRFLARTTSSGKAAWAPIFAPAPKGFRADGTALFSGDRLTGAVSQGETAALGWLLKQGGYSDLILPPGTAGREAAALRVWSRTLHKIVGDAEHARLDITLRAHVSQGRGLRLQNRSAAPLDAAAARQATLDIRAVLDRLQAAGSDVLGLGEILRERDPAAVRDWPRTFRRMRIGLRVKVDVLPSGRQA